MELSEEVEEELSWREAELAIFKRLVSSAPSGSLRERTLLRGALAMLYAHYEGFCQVVWKLYLEELESRSVKRKSLRKPLACLSLESRFSQLRGDTSAGNLLDFYLNELQSLLEEPASFEVVVDTQSNLWPETYYENMEQVCLPHTAMNDNERIMGALVSRRNDIAHGEQAYIRSVSEYEKYESATILVMHDLAVSVIETVEGNAMLKQLHPGSTRGIGYYGPPTREER